MLPRTITFTISEPLALLNVLLFWRLRRTYTCSCVFFIAFLIKVDAAASAFCFSYCYWRLVTATRSSSSQSLACEFGEKTLSVLNGSKLSSWLNSTTCYGSGFIGIWKSAATKIVSRSVEAFLIFLTVFLLEEGIQTEAQFSMVKCCGDMVTLSLTKFDCFLSCCQRRLIERFIFCLESKELVNFYGCSSTLTESSVFMFSA